MLQCWLFYLSHTTVKIHYFLLHLPMQGQAVSYPKAPSLLPLWKHFSSCTPLHLPFATSLATSSRIDDIKCMWSHSACIVLIAEYQFLKGKKYADLTSLFAPFHFELSLCISVTTSCSFHSSISGKFAYSSFYFCQECDKSNNDRLEESEIEEFCRLLMARPELEEIFRHYSGEDCVLSVEELREFLRDQGEEASLQQAGGIIQAYELNEKGMKRLHTLQGYGGEVPCVVRIRNCMFYACALQAPSESINNLGK